MKPKTLSIEWKHLDKAGKTCTRCGDTGKAVRRVVKLLHACCPRLDVRLKETLLGAKRLSESNEVSFNGKGIEELLPEYRVGQSACLSCSDLTGLESSCRALESRTGKHESIPVKLLWSAAVAALGCKCGPTKGQAIAACGCA